MSEIRQPGVRLAEDSVARKPVFGALLFVIAGTLFFSGWAWLLHLRSRAPAAPQARTAPAEIAEVRQTLVLEERPGQRQIREGREALSRWSWVDREQGIVAMPIEEAMRLLVEEGEGLQ